MILYIAEKPSLGRAIAAALPGPRESGDGYIRTGGDVIVSWCIGHMLEQAEPEAYDPAFKQWRYEHLPIVPGTWQLVEKKQTAKQLSVLRRLVKQAGSLVHAGDPDREGQLLVDEVIHYLGREPQRAQRLLINDLNTAAVAGALQRLRPNSEFSRLSTSALARSRADWLYGINLTRAYTLLGRKVNYAGVLSVGRVQTPLLGIVVRRDETIEQFVSKPFYEVWANLQTLPPAGGDKFRARWMPSESCARFLDSEGRNLSQPLAQNVATRITDQPARVTGVERKKRQSQPPLPHSLSSLQIDAARMYRLPAQRVLDICQALYEQHKLITYPRSDCRYLPAGHHGEAPQVVDAISHNPGGDKFGAVLPQLDLKRRSKAWNDKKVDAHHAIIPTGRKVNNLGEDERKVYSLVSRNYLAQFLPNHESAETRVEVDIKGGLFVAKAREELVAGWRQLFKSTRKKKPDTNDRADGSDGNDGNDGNDESEAQQTLPPLKVGQDLNSLQAEVVEKHTTPPARFNDASLLQAMTGIAAYVTDPELRRILKETDGLGTEATRAGIIELLFRRGFLKRQGKHIESTPAGRGLIHALPESATLPDRTARWESMLTAITVGSAGYATLMDPLVTEVTQMVRDSQEHLPRGLAGLSGPSPRRRTRSTGGAKKQQRTGTKPARGKAGTTKRAPRRKPKVTSR